MGRAFLFGCPEVLSPIGRRSRSDAAGTVLLGRRCSALLLNGDGLCGTVSGVKIDARTSQAELNLLVERGLRRDFLKCTPLNLKQFIPFTLLFLLFPGMVLGWRIGGLLTALFAAFLTGCLIWDAPGVATAGLRIWLFWGCATVLIVSFQVVRSGLLSMRRRRRLLPSVKRERRAGARFPQQAPLHWEKERVAGVECYVSRFLVEAPQPGFYAFLRTVDDYDGVLRYSPNTCFEQMEGKTGLRVNDLVVYRFDAGLHELVWATASAEGEAPKATISQLNRVG